MVGVVSISELKPNRAGSSVLRNPGSIFGIELFQSLGHNKVVDESRIRYSLTSENRKWKRRGIVLTDFTGR